MTPNLRVLHLVRSLRVGGLEKVVLDLTHGLAQRGVTSYLGCLLDAGEWADRANVEGMWTGNLEKRNPTSVLISLCRYVKRHRIDLVHTHNSHPHKYGVPLSILTGVPLVHTKHGRNWPDNPKWVWLSRQLSRFTKIIVPVSHDIERIVTDIEKVPKKKVVTILNGVEMGESDKTILRQDHSVRKQVGISADSFVIGSVGRFSPEKQYAWLVEVFAAVHEQVPASRLLLVGDGPERGVIEEAARRWGVTDAVILPGMQNNVRQWLQCMDVFCLSSDQEGTSITLLEAGGMGIPAVVTDVGGNGEIVQDGRTGLVVSPNEPGNMVDALLRLARDTELRRALGNHARQRIQGNYSMTAMVGSYMDVYRRALEQGTGEE